MDGDDRSDAELVRAYKSGDYAAFDAIVLRFQDRIFRLCSVWLRDPQHAPDASQEVFVRALRGLRRFRFRAEPFTWLYRTARLVCNEFNRRRQFDGLDEEPASQTPTPDEELARLQSATRVRELVATLPGRQQEVVMLRLFEDLPVRETARAMGCREGTVKALLYKARQALQRLEEGATSDD